jgi:hypothetical protein
MNAKSSGTTVCLGKNAAKSPGNCTTERELCNASGHGRRGYGRCCGFRSVAFNHQNPICNARLFSQEFGLVETNERVCALFHFSPFCSPTVICKIIASYAAFFAHARAPFPMNWKWKGEAFNRKVMWVCDKNLLRCWSKIEWHRQNVFGITGLFGFIKWKQSKNSHCKTYIINSSKYLWYTHISWHHQNT